MKQKDYKAIAEIIKKCIKIVELVNKETEIIYPETLIKELADYFEKEDKGKTWEIGIKKDFEDNKFNRKQFYEWAGVDEKCKN